MSIRFAASKLAPQGIEIRDLRFYVHQVELLTDNGQVRPVQLAQSPQQREAVALVDLREGGGLLQGTIESAAQYTGIRFTVGVPFVLNHANPLTAAAPLNHSDLFWSWNSGYKFLGIDLAEQGREWSFHLGSTGCSSASALRPPALACAQPNLMRVELRGFDPTQQSVVVRLNELVNVMHAANFAACTGDYQSTAACAAAYSKTGLEVVAGRCAGATCSTQTLFGVE